MLNNYLLMSFVIWCLFDFNKSKLNETNHTIFISTHLVCLYLCKTLNLRHLLL